MPWRHPEDAHPVGFFRHGTLFAQLPLMKKRIVVIGAGVAGCIITHALQRMPEVQVICLEQVAQGEHAGSGTGLNVGPNALKALRMQAPQLYETLLSVSLPWARWSIALTDGTPLFDLPLSQVADAPGIRIRWSGLYQVLRAAVPELVQYGTQVEGITRQANGRLSLHYAQAGESGSFTDIDLVIVTDGRYSTVRAQLAGAPKVRHYGAAIYRLLVPDTSGGAITDYGQWFNGPHRLLAFRVPGEGVYIAGSFPLDAGAPIPHSARDPAALRRFYTPTHGALDAPCAWMVEQICSQVDAIHWARLQESTVRLAEPNGRVIYAGDAAHGMVPTLGQGATQAVEGACVLARLLEKHIKTRASPCSLGSAWHKARAERLKFVMDFSVEASDTMLGVVDAATGSRAKAEPPFIEKLRRLYQDVQLPT
jgi:salicylate hydroxylase